MRVCPKPPNVQQHFMKKFLTSTLALILASSAFAQTPGPAPSDQAEAERYIRRSEADWAASVASGDSTVIDRILADDFVGVDTGGKMYDKSTELSNTREGPKQFASNQLDDVKLRFYGDTAIAQGSESWLRRSGEKGRFVWTDTWLLRNGKWQIIAAEDLSAPPMQTTEEDAIKARRAQQNAAIVASNIDEVASFWTDDVTICRGLGVQLQGKIAYRKLFEEDKTSANKIVYERKPRAIEVSSHWPLAFETGTWAGHVGDNNGATVISGKYSAQWVKRNGTWLIRSEVFVALGAEGNGSQMKAAP
jgi:ketosteroid isomerase-like protein